MIPRCTTSSNSPSSSRSTSPVNHPAAVNEPLLPRSLYHSQPYTFSPTPSISSSSSTTRSLLLNGGGGGSSTRRRRILIWTLVLIVGSFLVVVQLHQGTSCDHNEDVVEGFTESSSSSSVAVTGDWKIRMDRWKEWVKEQSGRVWNVNEDERLGFGWEEEGGGGLKKEDGDEGTKSVQYEEVLLENDADEGKDEETGEDSVAVEESETEVRDEELTMNVRPFARKPTNDKNVKYLSFENHSGFHNQRKSLVNALVLARLLNRTLVLPPARLGDAVPWGPEPDLVTKLVFSEECKAGFHPELPVARTPNSHKIAEQTECDDPNRWTRVGWSWLIDPRLLEGRQLVDRWNSSWSWFETSVEQGGLGLEPNEIYSFNDSDRRSYQIYDSRDTPTQVDLFQSRIDLDDLLEGPLAEHRLLRFGSLFSGARLNLVKEENQRDYQETFTGVVFRNEGLEVISNEVRDRLGSYVAIHARTGGSERGSVFYKKAASNMVSIFRKLTHEILGLRAKDVNRMVAESVVDEMNRPVRRQLPDDETAWLDSDYDEDEMSSPVSHLSFSPSSSSHSRRSFKSSTSLHRRAAHSGSPSRPLSPTLHCRKKIWPANDKSLSRLNTPLYIATDSRNPSTDPVLKIFFDWFPCIFLLQDFVEPTPGVSDEAVPALQALVNGGDPQWISDYDGQELAKYLYPFLEAEIAARAVEVEGTPQSTFSGYTVGILHQNYAQRGMLAPWDSPRSSH